MNMIELRTYLKKLYSITGPKLIASILFMVIISILEGFGIYMLVPMLSAINILDSGLNDSVPLEWVTGLLGFVPQQSQLLLVLLIFVVILTIQALMQRNQNILSSQIQQNFIHTLRYETYRLLIYSKWELFLTKKKSDFNHILTSELARVSQGTNVLIQLTASVIFTVIQIGFAFWLSVELTLMILGFGVVLFMVLRPFIRKAKALGDRTSDLSQQYMSEIVEHFNGMKDIKSNNLEQQHETGFRALCKRMEHNMVSYIRLNSATQLIYRIAAAVIIALFVYASLNLFSYRAEHLLLMIVIFSRLWPRFSMIQTSLEYIGSLIPAFRSLLQLQNECEQALETSSMETSMSGTDIKPIALKTGIRCDDVFYRYPGQTQDALQHVDTVIPVNGMTAIVGRSGAGKSTFIDLLMGLIQPTKGTIRLDEAPLEESRLRAWRQSISYVSQEPFLFHTSIRENLLLVKRDATEEELWESLRFAAADFVIDLPQGLDTIIGDRGVRLSGGERQRIVLARAILRKPAILILDEATSALDGENELTIQEALKALQGRMTIVVIAHRLTTIQGADQVIVLEGGRVMQQGAYDGLSTDAEGAFGQLLSYQTRASL
ncbi:ABC transporter ATP-binding protein [Paenibacillus sp. 453mf]|uniref:ABC transporter ATP-binding protein n=1 Tax=Paenibacillus sp. 453mf TaxID=1761874 RepID=UPI00147E7F46|nr:ABC transporter ATP-binding protein [Paenibacillus sp. 453mf]